MLPDWIVYPGTLLIVVGAVLYIRDIFRGTVRPNLVTWFLWSLAPLIAFGAQIQDGVGAPAVLTLMVGLCPLAVFIAGFRKGSFRPTRFDWWCGGMSLVALVLWQITGSGLVGLGLSILADTFGAAPTIRKSYKEPSSESPLFFALFAVSAGITLATIDEWTALNAAFSLYILCLNVLLFVLIKFEAGLKLQNVILSVPVNDKQE
jgi:hypothetical protein